ncbi:hypothetical protein [Virgibacillus sp. YIM 98842]|uniref:hypothetical protein n=1 Tax=Virgibacillus sp. YIM 98842 TaxID=2663533 RepID=UPI0013DA86A6|nr:hypothetical protein [Virgibacillus sp. YIM 98842]
MVPIYARNQDGRGYTIYLDTDTMRVYRSDHQETNQYKYWIGFVVTIAFLRGLAEFNLPVSLLVKSAVVIVGVPISIFIGRAVYRKSVQNMREIYPTKDMLEDYIVKGKSLMTKEIIIAGIILIVSLTFCFLYLVFNFLMWLILSLMFFAIVGMFSKNITVKRWKLYKYGLSAIGA